MDKVCRLYEEAVKQEPASEELHSHLFMSYVRVGDHRAQQRAAMQLYKFAPKNPYYFWAVMSIVLQVCSADCYLIVLSAEAETPALFKGIFVHISIRSKLPWFGSFLSGSHI